MGAAGHFADSATWPDRRGHRAERRGQIDAAPLAGRAPPPRARDDQGPSRADRVRTRTFPADQPFTARSYLTHMARLRRLPATAFAPWADHLVFTPLLDVPLTELSKGSAHKVGLIQALMAEPKLLILDEPFAGLDAETQATLPSLLAEQAAAGTTVIVSDHQRRLSDLSVDNLHVSAQTITTTTTPPPTETVIEVVVPPADTLTVLAKLRADGYRARLPR